MFPRLKLEPLALAALCALPFLSGCHHRAHTAYVAPPAVHSSSTNRSTNSPRNSTNSAKIAPPPSTPVPRSLPGKPTLVEVGMASWYGPQYNRRHAADGSVYDQDAMTAAHRTLPLGSLVRVTNLSTNETVVVRITDRGPFVHGRILDLSEGAAKAIGLYRMGIAKVRVEAIPTPTASSTGSWCVQTGAFATERDALDLKAALLQRYRGSRVQEFQGPTGYWVRIDPATHDRTQAAAIQDWIGKPDEHAEAFLVRVD